MAKFQEQIALNVTRDRTGWEAMGTSNLLKNIDHNFQSMLRADDIGALKDKEYQHLVEARKEVKKAARRLAAISRSMQHDRH